MTIQGLTMAEAAEIACDRLREENLPARVDDLGGGDIVAVVGSAERQGVVVTICGNREGYGWGVQLCDWRPETPQPAETPLALNAEADDLAELVRGALPEYAAVYKFEDMARLIYHTDRAGNVVRVQVIPCYDAAMLTDDMGNEMDAEDETEAAALHALGGGARPAVDLPRCIEWEV